MKAAVYLGVGQMEILDLPDPSTGSRDVLVRVKAAGVCGTDIKTYRRGHPAFNPPVVLGHEFAGVVEKVGEEVSWLRVGDRVAVAPYVNCGKCRYCEAGRGELCEKRAHIGGGAFAELVVVPEAVAVRGVVRLPEAIPYEEGAILEPLACCVRALRYLHLARDSTLLIVGAGFMGILNALAARALFGVERVVLAEVDPERRRIAREFGFPVVDPGPGDQNEEEMPGGEADAVILAVGAPDAFSVATRAARRGGVVHLFGGMPAGTYLPVPSDLVHYSGVSLVGSSGFAVEDFEVAAELVFARKVNAAPLLGAKFPLSAVTSAIEATGGRVLKTLVVP